MSGKVLMMFCAGINATCQDKGTEEPFIGLFLKLRSEVGKFQHIIVCVWPRSLSSLVCHALFTNRFVLSVTHQMTAGAEVTPKPLCLPAAPVMTATEPFAGACCTFFVRLQVSRLSEEIFGSH